MLSYRSSLSIKLRNAIVKNESSVFELPFLPAKARDFTLALCEGTGLKRCGANSVRGYLKNYAYLRSADLLFHLPRAAAHLLLKL